MVLEGHPMLLVALYHGTSAQEVESTYVRPSADDLHALVRRAVTS
jgi:hypothetical protein